MRIDILSDLFTEAHGLDRDLADVASANAMDDHQARDLLKMVRACRQACHDALARMPGRMPAASPEPAVLSHSEAMAMDSTFHTEENRP
jgi:hypothetical protein